MNNTNITGRLSRGYNDLSSHNLDIIDDSDDSDDSNDKKFEVNIYYDKKKKLFEKINYYVQKNYGSDLENLIFSEICNDEIYYLLPKNIDTYIDDYNLYVKSCEDLSKKYLSLRSSNIDNINKFILICDIYDYDYEIYYYYEFEMCKKLNNKKILEKDIIDKNIINDKKYIYSSSRYYFDNNSNIALELSKYYKKNVYIIDIGVFGDKYYFDELLSEIKQNSILILIGDTKYYENEINLTSISNKIEFIKNFYSSFKTFILTNSYFEYSVKNYLSKNMDIEI